MTLRGVARPGHDHASPPASGQAQASGSPFVPLNQSPGFWPIVGYAVVSGVVLAFAALAFLGLLKAGGKWFTLPKNPTWFSGSLWWVAVTAGAGVLVGVLRRALNVPLKEAGTIKELREERVDPSTVLQAVAVSLVSLVGGASLGPEAALGKMGGGFGGWVSARRKLDGRATATNTLSGMAAAYGGMLSSPILSTALVTEISRPKRARLGDVLVATFLGSTVAFAIYYPIAGTTFLGIYDVPSFKYENWQLAAAIPLGLGAGLLALITLVVAGLLKKLAAPLDERTILRPTLGGIALGLVGVALPLTMFTGTSQLTTVIDDGAALGAGLLIAVLFAKILVFALCEATGFIGGPILVMLFIGGTAGTAAHALIPGLPLGLAFACMFASILGALVAAPFSLILLVALTTQIGTLQLAPVSVAVLTAYLVISGTGVLMELAQRGRASAASSKDAPSAGDARAGTAT
jgi:chloride channel protein, CIC family